MLTMTIHVVYCTFSTKREAQRLIESLLDKKIIACASVYGVDSFFEWRQKRQKTKEWVAIIKTSKPKQVSNFLEKNHSYNVPCILSWRVKANAPFDKWVNSKRK